MNELTSQIHLVFFVLRDGSYRQFVTILALIKQTF